MSPGRNALERGRAWETYARKFLAGRNVQVITQGFRCRMGELDLIAIDKDELIVIEVRARAGRSRAIDSIGPQKIRRIINATRYFILKNPSYAQHRIRFDVITIDGIETGSPKLEWIPNAFDAT
jgi:putative endonuclease